MSWNFWLRQVGFVFCLFLLCTDKFADEDIDAFISRLEKMSPALVTLIEPAVEEVKRTARYANAAGVSRAIYFHPLMLGSHHSHFKDGILVEVVRRGKRQDVLAAGGRSVTNFSSSEDQFSFILETDMIT